MQPRPFVLAVALALVAGVAAAPAPPLRAASTAEPSLSAWGTAHVDGVIGRGEWDGAAKIDFEAVLPPVDGGAGVPASIYVMNDATNLYLAAALAAVPGCTFNPIFEFDNNNDGDLFKVGNDWVAAHVLYSANGPVDLLDQFEYPVGNVGLDTSSGPDYPPAGTIDGRAAGSHPGGATTWVEMSHPLDSADDLHDFSLGVGDTVGFVFTAHTYGTGCGNCTGPGCHGTTLVPAEGLGHIRIASPPAVTNMWRAGIGRGGTNGAVTIEGYASGSGSITLRLAKLTPATIMPVVLSRGTCATVGSTLIRLPAIKTTSAGAASRTNALTVTQTNAIRSATKGGGRLAIRIGSGVGLRCGVFTMLRPPAARATVVATVRVAPAPSAMTADRTGIWVASSELRSISRVEPASNTVTGVVNLGSAGTTGPWSLASGFGSLWATLWGESGQPGSVLRIDPLRGSTEATISGFVEPQVAAGAGAVWILDTDAAYETGTVVRVDPATNRIVARIAIGMTASGIAVGEGAVWITNGAEVLRIDPLTNSIAARIELGVRAKEITTGGGSVWLTAGDDATLTRIDPATDRVVRTVELGVRPFGLAFGGGYVWVKLDQEAALAQVDGATMTIRGRVPLWGLAHQVVATGRSLWVASAWAGVEWPGSSGPGMVTRLSY